MHHYNWLCTVASHHKTNTPCNDTDGDHEHNLYLMLLSLLFTPFQILFNEVVIFMSFLFLFGGAGRYVINNGLFRGKSCYPSKQLMCGFYLVSFLLIETFKGLFICLLYKQRPSIWHICLSCLRACVYIRIVICYYTLL